MIPDLTQQILNSLTSGVLAVDRHGVVLASNPAAASHLDDELKPGQSLRKLPGGAPFLQIIEEIIEQGGAVQRREIFLERDDGSQREIGLTASPLVQQGGETGVIFLFTDMTERRILERAAEINRQLADLGELSAGVVHELRTPVMVISGMAELMMRRLHDQRDLHEQAATIAEECKDLENTIAQFLEFARPFELDAAKCYPENITERALRLARSYASRKGVEIESEIGDDLPQMEADVAKAGQALANLLNNAVDAVDERDGKVRLRTNRLGPYILFEVKDNGPGVRLAPGADLFRPFYSQKEGGTGLGLSIVSRIVNAHGGTIHWENCPEGGARFEIRLPIRKGVRL